MDQGRLMDGIYRYQRYFYDVTRRFFLAGRDRLLASVQIPEDGYLLEVGCGTGRNLLVLAKRYPKAHLFGLDVSARMLEPAEIKIRKSGFSNICVALGEGEAFDRRRIFGLERAFDAIIFSYSLSMILDWRSAMESAVGNLGQSGRIYVVDFFDQQGWPGWSRRMLTAWLAMFHVRYEPELIDYLRGLEEKGWWLGFETLVGRYAFLAVIRRVDGN